MKYYVYILLLLSLSMANSNYCLLPDIIDGASRTNSREYSYEDVITLDYGFVQDLYIGNENFETWFTYTGPKPIKLNDLTLHPKEMIEILFNYYGK